MLYSEPQVRCGPDHLVCFETIVRLLALMIGDLPVVVRVFCILEEKCFFPIHFDVCFLMSDSCLKLCIVAVILYL